MTSVVTVTVNPAVDLSFEVDQLVPDHKMRARAVRREPGGGGVNVARVLRRLGVASTAVVVVGGPTGDELLASIEQEDVEVVPVWVAGNTRESVSITEAATGMQYRSVLPGPAVDDPSALLDQIVDQARGADILVVSGSFPPGLPDDAVNQLLDQLGNGAITIVDTHGAALLAAASGSASVIKPSQRELAALVGWEPVTALDVERAAEEVLALGSVAAVVASRGPSGAVLARRDAEPLWFRPPAVKPRSTVGAGDSMIAGIVAGLVAGESLVYAVARGIATGTATVLSPGSDLCDPRDVERLLPEVLTSPRSGGHDHHDPSEGGRRDGA